MSRKALRRLILLCFLCLLFSGCQKGDERVETGEVFVEVKEEAEIETAPKTEEELEPEGDTEVELESEGDTEGKNARIVIDAGHQRQGNSAKEPVGPGASKMKAKVAGGTVGVTTGLPEYELTLQVSQKLQQELEERGYEVIMVRTVHDVNISNSERAGIANEAGADAFIRVHANGSANAAAHGAMTICQTPSNPYNGQLYEKSRALSGCVLDALVEAAGCKRERVWETDTMSGINWCFVPVTIVEIGYMTNPQEDELLSTEAYQWKIAEGIANGIENYFDEEG